MEVIYHPDKFISTSAVDNGVSIIFMSGKWLYNFKCESVWIDITNGKITLKAKGDNLPE